MNSMNIIVCMKQVPDTETRIKIKEGEKKIDEEGINWIINPYDEFAIEEALRIKEKIGDATVTLISVGPTRAQEAIRTGLAMGADNGRLLCDEIFTNLDSIGVAKVLAAAIKKENYDLILCGHKAIDDDCVQVGSALAELLNLPQAYIVTKLQISDDKKKAICNRQVEGAELVVEVTLPAVITCQKGLNEPRYPSLPGIMKAKKKELKILSAADLGITKEEIDPKLEIVDMYLPPPRTKGTIIEEEDPEKAASQLAKLLREEAKVI